MPEVPISQSDVESLGGKLGGLELSFGERLLLAAVVRVAADAAGESGAMVVDDPAPSITEQFIEAFTPGPIVTIPPPQSIPGPKDRPVD